MLWGLAHDPLAALVAASSRPWPCRGSRNLLPTELLRALAPLAKLTGLPNVGLDEAKNIEGVPVRSDDIPRPRANARYNKETSAYTSDMLVTRATSRSATAAST